MELAIGLVLGLCVGAAVVYFVLNSSLGAARQQLAALEAQREAELKAADEKLALLEEARAKLEESFKALSADALSKNNESFLKLAEENLKKYQEGAKSDLEKRQESIQKTVEPVGEALKVFNQRVDKIEERRTETDASLKQQLEQLAHSQVQLSQTTGSLVQALRAPQVRGQWGEMQLKKTVEMSGMIDRVDFIEQASVETDEGQRQRPDMIINLPNERQVVVDSKVPLAAYLDALQSDDADVQTERMETHARHIRDHIKGLSQKAYWNQFESAPEFVVLFIPNEAIFSAALEQDPSLIELGVKNQVIISTPTTLIALLKAVAYGWQQEAIAREAKNIAELGRELYERIGVVTGHFGDLGRSLGQSVDRYNKAVKSIDGRLLVTAQKLKDKESISTKELPEVAQVEKQPSLPKESNETE